MIVKGRSSPDDRHLIRDKSVARREEGNLLVMGVTDRQQRKSPDCLSSIVATEWWNEQQWNPRQSQNKLSSNGAHCEENVGISVSRSRWDTQRTTVTLEVALIFSCESICGELSSSCSRRPTDQWAYWCIPSLKSAEPRWIQSTQLKSLPLTPDVAGDKPSTLMVSPDLITLVHCASWIQ